MRKEKKRKWLKRITGFACAAVMASSVLFVNTNSASRAYASDVSAEDTDTVVSSEEVIAEGAAESQSETEGISLTSEQQETNEQPVVDAQIESASANEVQNEDAAYETEQLTESDISSDEISGETENSSQDAASEEITDTGSTDTTEASEVTYSYQIADKGITVNAEAVRGSLPDDAVLKVTPVEENTVHYTKIEEKLKEKADSESYSIAGFLAYDVAFADAEGNEIEPVSGNVKVSFLYEQSAMPDAVKDNSKAQDAQIKVLHFVEDEGGNVTDVLDLTDNSTTTVSATANNEVQNLSFETDSFSDIVIPWVTAASNETLGTVETIDSSKYITMKMINYPGQQFTGATWTSSDPNVKQGLLSNTLGNDGYPTFITEKNYLNGTSLKGKSLGQFFDNYSGGMTAANHLFLKSAYDGNDGLINDPGTYYYDSGYNGASFNASTGNFTVYNFLTTTYSSGGFWAERGNFLPYNTFDKHTESGRTNKYDSQGNALDSSDSMYGKTLYLPDESAVDYYFGMELDSAFSQPASGVDDDGHAMTFEFTGDDDMWVYIDGVLVLDIGGCHDARSGSINFKTGEVKVQGVSDTTLYQMFKNAGKTDSVEWNSDNSTFADYSAHTIKVFYMERGAGASNLRLKFNLNLIESYDADFTVEKTFTGITQDQIDSMADGISYTLKAYNYSNDENSDDNGEAADAPYNNTVLKLTDSNVSKTTTEDGSIKYTWTLPKCTYSEYESYVYKVEENGGNLSGYTCELTKTASATGATVQDDRVSVLITKPSEDTDISAVFSLTNKYSQNDPPSGGDEEETPEIKHTKTIKADTENPEQYELSLDAKGTVVETPENADIVLVVDKSGSMDENDKVANLNNAISIMKQQLQSYVDKWSGDKKPVINLSVVEFSSGATQSRREETSSQYERTASSSIAQNWTKLSDFSYQLENPTGGTNWQAGILTAETLMSQKAGDNYNKFVIILTDGNPTFRYSSDGSAVASNYADSTHLIYGTGSSDYNSYNYNAALNQWRASENLIKSSVYVIQADSSASKCQDFVYDIDESRYSSYAKWMDGTDRTSLENDFKTIVKEITHVASFTDVTIHDTLSDNVKFAETNPDIKVYKVDADGNETLLDASKYTLTLTENSVDVKFKESLEDGYTYEVKFKVAAKTDKGIDALIKGNGVYGNTGDEGTDAKDNETSSNKDGLWSNDSAKTYITYTVNNKTDTKEYKKPVVQINTVSASATKVWKCKDESESHDPVNVNIKASVNIDESGNEIKDGRDITAEVFTGELANKNIQSLSDENSWTYKWSYLPKYYHYTKDGKDAAAVITYTVTESDVPDGYECEITYAADPDDADHTIWTITNTEKLAKLDLKMADYKDISKYLDGSVFTLEKKNESTGEWSKIADYEIKNGDSDIELKDIQKGCYRLYEKMAPNGYSILSDKIYFKADSGIITLTDESGNPVSDEQKMWTLEGNDTAKVLTIKNCEIYSLPASGSFGIYPFTIGGVAVIATALLLFIKNKQKEDA